MWFVYIIRSLSDGFLYVGSTNNVNKRLNTHNEGYNQSTKGHVPFELEAYVAVRTERKARELEKYFKTGSGKAIQKKEF